MMVVVVIVIARLDDEHESQLRRARDPPRGDARERRL